MFTLYCVVLPQVLTKVREVVALLEALNVNTRNPAVVMTQDTARRWLSGAARLSSSVLGISLAVVYA